MVLPLPSTYNSADRIRLGWMYHIHGIHSGTTVLYWYAFSVYGMCFPMGHLCLLHYLVFLDSLNVEAFVQVSMSMVTVPLL